MSTKALRYNDSKPDYTFAERSLLDGLSRGMVYGASKYARDNWKLSIGTEDHDSFQHGTIQSMLRHIMAVAAGELVDEESGNLHMDHVACNVMMWLTYQENKNDV